MAFPPQIARSTRVFRAARAALVALPCALAAGCGAGDLEARPGEGALQPVVVELERIEAETLRDVVTFSGQLDAEHSVMIKPETDGVIASVDFEGGQEVARGTVLFRLRSEEQAARLREALAMQALAREVYGRTQELASRDATSLAQKDRAAAELEVARARVELARLELDRTQIRAPFDGVLGMRLVSPGDRVTDEISLVQIDAVERLQLSFGVSEQGVAFAKLGVAVELRVPESAVVFDRQGTYLWRVDEEQRAARVPVELGLRKGGRVEVTMGLRPGDTVVTAGTHKVAEGRELRAAARPPVGRAQRAPASDAEPGEGT